MELRHLRYFVGVAAERMPSASRRERLVRIAIIHDWLGPMSGAERVLEQMLICFPRADVFTAVDFLATGDRHVLRGAKVTPSFIQRMPAARTNIWNYVPLMPTAMARFDLRGYDLVLSNSHAVAKGVRVHPDQLHVCYLLSPMRFAWDLEDMYRKAHRADRGLRGVAARVVLAYLRNWDVATSPRVARFITASRYIADRAMQSYGRDSVILHPPVDTEFFTPGGSREDFYLAASRLTPFKRMDLLVEAFRSMPDRRLVVIGDGPERDRVRALAGPNVSFLGRTSDDVLRDHMRRARAFLFAAPEDFGIVMAEAQACGAPVIAFGQGGAREILRGLDDPEPTGAFFEDQTPESVRDAVRRLESRDPIPADRCRTNVMRFSPDRFRVELTRLVAEAVEARTTTVDRRQATQ
jgi:glycosyltransferase involved in cell wall biosynthesis